MRIPRLLALTTALLLTATAACGDDGGTTEVVTTRPALDNIPVVTGMPDVDHLIAAARAKDVIELAGLTQYQLQPCTLAPVSGGPPGCREGEAEGDLVEVMAASSCEDGWVRPEHVPDAYRLALEPGEPTLVAVYRPAYTPDTYGANGPSGAGHDGKIVAVYDTGNRDDGTAKGVALHMNPGRVVWIETDCGGLLELLDPARAASYLIEPPNSE